MTKDEKIKEVMELAVRFAIAQANAREASVFDEPIDVVSRLYDAAYLAHGAIESKLRELIQ